MKIADGCTCGKVVLNHWDKPRTGGVQRKVVGLDWHEDCPVHGIGTEWYESEGKARMEATRQRSIDLQMQAREARRKWREEHPDEDR